MRKKMKKYQPGGEQGMGTRNQPTPVNPVPVNPVMKQPPNSAPVNASQPQAPQAPVTPITSNATGAAPDPTMNAYNRNIAMGMNPRRARNMAMKETGIKTKIDPNKVIGTIGEGLKLANSSANTIGAFRSAFQKNGGEMSGKQLRKTSGFMKEGGIVKKAARKANKAVKKYVGAAKAYDSGNMKKGDRLDRRGDKFAAKLNKLQTAKRGGTKTRKK